MTRVFDRAVVVSLPLVPRPLVRRFADRYMAGETLEQAVETVRRLNRDGVMATVDVLGEFIRREDEAEATATAYEQVLDAIAAERLDANISVKLSALGIELDPTVADRTLRRLLVSAERHGIFVRIDMEHSGLTDQTLALYRTLRGEGRDGIGVVLQAYLRRTMDDVAAIADLVPNVRVVKGIYVEPEEIAYQDPAAVNGNFMRIVERLLDGGSYVAVATHDRALVEEMLGLVDRRSLPGDAYEFQMLLGVTESLRRRLVDAGHRMRVYVPFGRAWYGYSVRRLKENPSIAGYVARDVLRSLVPGVGR
ncbi:MAG TPA: proline dehydrogenase family protein [Gaiellales bacterium]|nr:proline dehydrogenase family protein [Gaiellales bacterium]